MNAILSSYEKRRDNLIPILQHVQEEFGYLPEEAMLRVARSIGVPESRVYAVATFYTMFRFTPMGKNRITICRGTACHVRGATRLLDAAIEHVGVGPGETSEDGKFSLERVACFGCCALAPVLVVDDTVHSKMTPPKTKEVLSSY